MELTVYERLILGNILPPENDLTTLLTIRKLREALAFDEEEALALDIQPGMDWLQGCPRCGGMDVAYPGPNLRLDPQRKCNACGFEAYHGPGQMFWNRAAEQVKDVNIGKKGREIVVKQLEELGKQGKLREAHYPLLAKFGLAESDNGEGEAG